MTPEQQRIALAEWAGWKRPDHPDVMKFKEGWTMPEKWWMCPQGDLRFKHDIPDYLNDLNAVHDLEMKLTAEQQFEYVYALNEALGLVPLDSPASYREVVLWVFTHSTAAQRCEALLKTLNLWTP